MDYRCGKHAVVANPASRIPVWTECTVHRFTETRIKERFQDIIHLEFYGEELLRLGWIVRHAMLD
jgi:hypothetical protein